MLPQCEFQFFSIVLVSFHKKMILMEKKKQKNHADFQDNYRRSSNFRSIVKKEKFEISDPGNVKIVKEE